MYNRDEHSLIQDMLDTDPDVLPKGKKHQQQATCSASTIQAYVRTRESDHPPPSW